MVMTKQEFTELMKVGLRRVFDGVYKELPQFIPEVFTMISSKRAFEDFYGVGNVPDIPEFTGQLTYLDMAPGFKTSIEPKVFAAGMQFQREAFDDEQYGMIKNAATKFYRAANRTREKKGVRLFDNAFSTSYDFMTSEEGVALCSNSHLTKTPGVSTTTGFDNAGTTALSKTALAAARLAMKGFKDDIGELYDHGEAYELWVPKELEETAYEITMTPKSLDTSDGNVNFHFKRYTVKVHDRFSDTNNWFLVDKMARKENVFWLDRVKPEDATDVDFETFIRKISVYMRFGYVWTDWRWVYGSQVS